MIKRRFHIRVRTVDERPVRCRVVEPAWGDGDPAAVRLPLLLLHGLGCSAEIWEPALRCLAEHGLDQPVWAPDLPGCGHSPGPPEALGMEELADWAVRLLDALAIHRAHIVAHSMGSQVTMALARRHPERVGGIVLVGPTTGRHAVYPHRYAVGLVAGGLREPVLYSRLLVRMYQEMGLWRYLATARRMMEDDPLAGIAAVTAPCLVMQGQQDEVVPLAAARRLAAALPAGAYLEVSGARHVIQLDTPERFVLAALAFLAGTRLTG
jgi:pimeloyl-ACP methyl ester carboxylesterase